MRMNGRIAMSIASTRRVSTSLSFGQPVGVGYDVAAKNQSSVETIDTANNVLVDDETNNRGGNYLNQEFVNSEEHFSDIVVEDDAVVSENEEIALNNHVAPLLDNDDISYSMMQNHSVGIYGANQAISANKEDNSPDNPYLKFFYDNNKIVEDVDELV